MKKNLSLSVLAILLLVSFLTLNLVISWFIGSYKIDTTSQNKYTLLKNSVEIAKNVQKPTLLKLYISNNLGAYDVDRQNYANYLVGILSKYQEQNPEMITFEIRRVSSFSEMEKNAVKDGIKPVMVDGENLYLGLSIIVEDGYQDVIPNFEPARINYLQTDINRVLYKVINPNKPVIGITAPNLPVFNPHRKEKNWSIVPLLQNNYDVIEIPDNRSYIPFNTDLIIVINPTELPERFIYALDQFLMRGGSVIIFIDPYSEILHFYQGYPPVSKTNLQGFLHNYGIIYDKNLIIGDIMHSEKVSISSDGVVQSKSYPLWFYAKNSDFENLHFRTPGSLGINEKDNLTITPLIATDNYGGMINSAQIRYNPKSKIINLYNQTNEQYILALKTEGQLSSYFTSNIMEHTDYVDKIPPYLPLSTDAPKLIVIADSDFVSDDAWVYQSNKANPIYGTIPYASNADFLLNIIDEIIGGRELIKPENIGLVEEKSNITLKIYNNLYEQSKSRIEELERLEMKSEAAMNDLRQAIRISDHGELLEYQQLLDGVEKLNNDYKTEIKYINYTINSSTDNQINFFIILNVIIFPLSLLIIIFALLFVLRRINLAKAEVVNE